MRTVAHTDHAPTFEHECCGAWWKFGRGSRALSITYNYWSQIVFEPSTSPKWSQDLHWRDPYVERAWRTTRDFPMRKSAVRVHEQRHVKDDSTAYDAVKKMLETYEKEYSSKTECEKAYDEAEKKAREMLNDAATRSQAMWN